MLLSYLSCCLAKNLNQLYISDEMCAPDVHIRCTYTHLLPRLFLNRLNFEMSADQREDHALQILQQEQT